jgi:hypothetical protein
VSFGEIRRGRTKWQCGSSDVRYANSFFCCEREERLAQSFSLTCTINNQSHVAVVAVVEASATGVSTFSWEPLLLFLLLLFVVVRLPPLSICHRLDAGIDTSCKAKPSVQNSTYMYVHVRGAIVRFLFLITKKCAIRRAFGQKMAALTVPISRPVYIARNPQQYGYTGIFNTSVTIP